MKTVIAGSIPEIDALIERRRVLGLDGRDEIWKGVYHLTPYANMRHSRVEFRLGRVLDGFAAAAGLEMSGHFNLGDADDYRIPDLGLHEPGQTALYVPTAKMVIEVLSPNDETFEKFDFYWERRVEEIMVVDPEARSVRLWREGSQVAASVLLGAVSCADIESVIDWP